MGPTAGQQSTPGSVEAGKNPVGDEELDDEGNPKAKAGDAEPSDEEKTKTADAMRDTVTRAEILVPGFKMPTADAAPRRLADVAGVQRKVLTDAARTEDGKAVVAPLLAGRTVDSLSAAEVSTVFIAASEMARHKNNTRGARHGVNTKDAGGKTVTPADINARNVEFWKSQQ
jgi:hypothetical protein